MSVARPKKAVDDYEEVITELKTRVQVLEGETDTAVTERENFTADYEHLKTTNRVCGRTCACLYQLTSSQSKLNVDSDGYTAFICVTLTYFRVH